MVAKWFPTHEKSTVVAIVTTGNQIGPVLAYPLGSIFCPMRDFMGGWPMNFYTAGSFRAEHKKFDMLFSGLRHFMVHYLVHLRHELADEKLANNGSGEKVFGG